MPVVPKRRAGPRKRRRESSGGGHTRWEMGRLSWKLLVIFQEAVEGLFGESGNCRSGLVGLVMWSGREGGSLFFPDEDGGRRHGRVSWR